VYKWFLVILSTLLVACGPEARQTHAADEEVAMTVDGHARQYWMHTPPTYQSDRSVPLVLVLHGGQGDGHKVSEQTGFSRVSDREGFVVVYPSSIAKKTPWYDGRDTANTGIDDVVFIEAVVKDIQRKRNIDLRRVYVTGVSAGGAMTQHLACERSDLFTAYASVIANMSFSLAKKCRPSSPVSMLLINGVADPIMPYNGGEIRKGRRAGNGGSVMSVKQTTDFWVRNNGCGKSPARSELEDRDRRDGTRVSVAHYAQCQKGSEVRLLSIKGGGHTWPGSPMPSKGLRKRIVGVTSQDINASDVVWSFFQQHSR